MLSAGVEKGTVKYKNFFNKKNIIFNKNFFITDRQGPAGAKERHAEGLGDVAQKPECDGRVFLPCPTYDRSKLYPLGTAPGEEDGMDAKRQEPLIRSQTA